MLHRSVTITVAEELHVDMTSSTFRSSIALVVALCTITLSSGLAEATATSVTSSPASRDALVRDPNGRLVPLTDPEDLARAVDAYNSGLVGESELPQATAVKTACGADTFVADLRFFITWDSDIDGYRPYGAEAQVFFAEGSEFDIDTLLGAGYFGDPPAPINISVFGAYQDLPTNAGYVSLPKAVYGGYGWVESVEQWYIWSADVSVGDDGCRMGWLPPPEE